MKIAYFAFCCGFSFALMMVSGFYGNVVGVAFDAFSVLWSAAFLALAFREKALIA